MASRGNLTLKMQRIQLSKIVGLSRMDLQVLKWECPVARMAREWAMMLTELATTETTGRLDVSEYRSHVHESCSIELKFSHAADLESLAPSTHTSFTGKQRRPLFTSAVMGRYAHPSEHEAGSFYCNPCARERDMRATWWTEITEVA